MVNALKLSCASQNPKIISIALDCIHKLMAYGYLQGELIDEHNPEIKLINTVIDIVKSCFENPTDEGVRLQIIKAFLTAVTSPVCDVHESSLMSAVRTCYNVYLITKNEINRTTAKATLTQMLNSIFQRMERQNEVSLKLKNIVVERVLFDILANVRHQLKPNAPPLPEPKKPQRTETPVRKRKQPKYTKKQMFVLFLFLVVKICHSFSKNRDITVYKDCSLIFNGLCKLAEKELDQQTMFVFLHILRY